jgi:hypothetical protein
MARGSTLHGRPCQECGYVNTPLRLTCMWCRSLLNGQGDATIPEAPILLTTPTGHMRKRSPKLTPPKPVVAIILWCAVAVFVLASLGTTARRAVAAFLDMLVAGAIVIAKNPRHIRRPLRIPVTGLATVGVGAAAFLLFLAASTSSQPATDSRRAAPVMPTAARIDPTPTAAAPPVYQAAPTARPEPTVAPTPHPAPTAPKADGLPVLLVVNCPPDGVSLRSSPGTGERIKVWKDGTEVQDFADVRDEAGMKWRRVRDPDGNEGWIAADFLAPKGERSSTAASAPPAKPAPSAEVRAYLDYIGPKLTAGGAALRSLSALSQGAGSTPSLMNDENLRMQMALPLGQMRAAGQKLQSYEPVPNEAGALDRSAVSIGKDLVYVSTEMAEGLRSRDGASIDNATARMNQLPDKLRIALEQVRELTEAHR